MIINIIYTGMPYW